MSAARLVKCPSCSKDGLKRLIGRGGGIIFKGSGFYQTDYKKAPSGGGETAGENKPASSAASDSSKPAASGSSSANQAAGSSNS